MSDEVDLLVIGGGSAGIVAAITAAGLGAKVTLVERERTGGDCLWFGCVPSKAFLAAAAKVQGMRAATDFVTNSVAPEVDFAAVMAHVHAAIKQIEPVDSPQTLEAAGIEVIKGEAVFTGPREARIGERQIAFRHAIIAAGSVPAMPDIPGLAQISPLTNENVWDLKSLPARLVIIGGGPIGCELGQAFARLGSQVTIIERTERLLPTGERQASEVLGARLIGEGIVLLTETDVSRVSGVPGKIELQLHGPDGAQTLSADQVLVATGRKMRPGDFGLAAAEVQTDGRGYVSVDASLRTSNTRIFAAGDVTGGPAFTHVAGFQGSVAATNALLGPFRKVKNAKMPAVTFTDPEVAQVGLTESEARERHGKTVQVQHLSHSHVDRAVVEGRTEGFTRVVLDGNKVVGATIVAPRAGEMIAEFVASVANGGRLRDIARVVHAYPAWTDGVWNAAVAQVRTSLQSPTMQKTTSVLMHVKKATERG